MNTTGPAGQDPATQAAAGRALAEAATTRIDTPPWWLDPGLAKLAFGSRVAPAAPAAGADTIHLAFLPIESLELDLADPAQREFGDYELLEQIGQGGMGVVYRARQKSLEREVALKLLSAGPWASEEFIAGFRREARNAASLQHPNIVAVYEMGEQEGLIFYAMQLIRGQSLAQCLQARRTLPPREAAILLRTVAEAVDYAHRLGVLHLDLKPGNILLDGDGVAQVTDFGLARRLGQAPSVENEQISGTPSYMAPEQAQVRNARLSAATDIWGIGAVLYETLTGTPPFTGHSPQEILQRVIAGTVRNPDRYAHVPRDLHAICLKCLNKAQAERYASARELADDLGRFLEHRSVQARPLTAAQRVARWARREPKFALASGMAVVALVAGLVATTTQWQRAEGNAHSARAQTWQTRGEAAWRLIDEDRNVDAMPLLVDNLREREAYGDAAGVALERLRIGSLQRGGAQLIDAIATGAVGRALDLDRTGTRVAVADLAEDVRLYDVADGRLLWQASVRKATHFRAMAMPLTRVEFSPDGRYLVTATMEPGTFVRPHGRNNVLLQAADGAVLAPPAEVFPDFLDATYDAHGRHALLRNTHGDIQLFAVDGWRALTPRRRLSGLGGSWRLGDQGRYLARADNNHRVELLDPRNLQPRHALQFAPETTPQVWAAQPGGDLLALGHADGSVRLLDSARLSLRELVPAPSKAIDTIAFSADGRWLTAGSGGRVWLWDAASGLGGVLSQERVLGRGQPSAVSRLHADPDSGTVFAFGPWDSVLWRLPEYGEVGDDLRLRIAAARIQVPQFAFGSYLPRNAAAYAPAANLAANIERNGELRLWRLHARRPLPLHGSAQGLDELHFDGRHVVAVDGAQVRVVTLDGTDRAPPALDHPQPVSLAAFTPDGNSLVTVSGRELRAFDWRSGHPRFAAIALDNSPLRVAISPDSRTLLATSGGYRGEHYHEFASSFDLGSGAALARDIALPGPLNGLRFSPDSRRLVHWRYGEAQVRDARDLDRIGPVFQFGPDIAARRRATTAMQAAAADAAQETPIIHAALSADGARLTLVLHGAEPVKPRLLQADVASGRILASRDLPPGPLNQLWPRGDGYDFSVWAAGAGAALWMDSTGGMRPLPHARGEPLPAQAVSRDGRWLAVSSTGGVLLVDRDSGQWASVALDAQLPLNDQIVQLAFAPDGSRLLARSHQGRWSWWPLSPDTQPVAQLVARAAHLRPAAGTDTARFAAALPVHERAQLRATDPGPPRQISATPVAAAPPAASPAAAPGFAFVDLRPAINRRVDAADLFGGGQIGDFGYLASVPLGRQRLLGVEFDIQGVVALRMREAPQGTPGLPVATPALPPPQPRLAALHLLLGGCCPLPAQPTAAYAYLLLRYGDGSQARLPILHQQHLWQTGEDTGDGRPARIGWVGAAYAGAGYNLRLYAARLDNPHPDRDVVSLTFEASEFFASGPMVFAATAELPADAVAGRAAGTSTLQP